MRTEGHRLTPSVVRISRYPFSETITRLGIEIANAGATLFCRLDQSGAPLGAGLRLRPTMLFIFGNPNLGAQVMEAFPLVGLDLPLRLLVWEEYDTVSVAFVSAATVAERYEATGMSALFAAMDEQLERLVATVTTRDSAS